MRRLADVRADRAEASAFVEATVHVAPLLAAGQWALDDEFKGDPARGSPGPGPATGQSVVLVADETGDVKSSTDCVGAGRQYSGAIGGVGLCQVAVHLAAVTATTKVIIDRALYLPADWAADEERREAAGVPEEIVFATKP